LLYFDSWGLFLINLVIKALLALFYLSIVMKNNTKYLKATGDEQH